MYQSDDKLHLPCSVDVEHVKFPVVPRDNVARIAKHRVRIDRILSVSVWTNLKQKNRGGRTHEKKKNKQINKQTNTNLINLQFACVASEKLVGVCDIVKVPLVVGGQRVWRRIVLPLPEASGVGAVDDRNAAQT